MLYALPWIIAQLTYSYASRVIDIQSLDSTILNIGAGLSVASLIVGIVVFCGAGPELLPKWVKKKLLISKEDILALLPHTDKELVLNCIAKEEKIKSLKEEYEFSHRNFIIKYFGSYSTEAYGLIDREVKVDPRGEYLLALVEESSPEHKEIKHKIYGQINSKL